MKQLFLFSILCMLGICCSKNNDEKDHEAPAITIISPGNGSLFTAGETIYIKGTITDNQHLSQVHIEVNDLTTGAAYLHVHIHPNNKIYAFDQSLAAGAGTGYKIKVTAEDPSANSLTQQVEVSCN